MPGEARDEGADLAHEREVLRQAGIALNGRIVTLWEISPADQATPLLSSVPNPSHDDTCLDLNSTLRQWGAPLIRQSRWVGCRAGERAGWCVAPVRIRPAAPPPRGIERRNRDRLVLELAGLSLGVLGAAGAARTRLPPADALRELARQPSVIAHEVGNPLTVALGNLDLSVDALREANTIDTTLRGQLLEDLSRAGEAIEQAASYLRSIQDRPFGGATKSVRFDVMPIVRSCVTLERPLARRRGVTLEWQSTVESVYLVGDEGALYQILTNLVRNAVGASRLPKSMVRVTIGRNGDKLRLAVRDEGVGIPRDHLGRIFDAGFTTKAPGEGSGIGLAVVKEITENMFGGEVSVESVIGKGSTFTLTLPIPPQRR